MGSSPVAVIKKSIKNFNWAKSFKSFSIDLKVDLLNGTSFNHFQDHFLNKKIKCDSHQPPWMTDIIKRSLKEHSKLTKCYYKNGQKKIDFERLLKKFSNCTEEILEAKNN